MGDIDHVVFLETLETVIRDAEDAQARDQRATVADACSQAWGICRVYSLAVVRTGLPDWHLRFDELEERRKRVTAWLYNR